MHNSVCRRAASAAAQRTAFCEQVDAEKPTTTGWRPCETEAPDSGSEAGVGERGVPLLMRTAVRLRHSGPDRDQTFLMSCPCAVSAQITKMSNAMMIIAHSG